MRLIEITLAPARGVTRRPICRELGALLASDDLEATPAAIFSALRFTLGAMPLAARAVSCVAALARQLQWHVGIHAEREELLLASYAEFEAPPARAGRVNQNE